MQRAIASIPGDAWTTIDYPDAVRDEDTGQWMTSSTPWAETTATSPRPPPSRLTKRAGHPTLYLTHQPGNR